ncbi:ATP-binding protein [Cellulomonas sp. PS-H5]|uniref:AAA family ATPase n=1 Tax=Cellulomonas sp. PS-H5 TaxID=2820400 RepID=UPI001C4E9F67|nr:ATP-binding protein [Cellulomonas sp. PS-H5]MBW0256409.1 ATP-binding protein [Cellulomonas sp. PS-H5]
MTDGTPGAVAPDPDPARTDAFLDAVGTLIERVNDRAQRRRSGDATPIAEVLREHLGTDPRGLAVLTEEVGALRAVDADVALEVVVGAAGGGRLVGVGGGEQRRHSSFSEIVEHSGAWAQFPVGAVDYVRVPVGPDADRRVVAFGVHLFRFGGAPVALLQRAAAPQQGQEAKLEAMSPDEDAAAAALAAVREAMLSHSVLRGQVVSFTPSPYGQSAGGVTFLPRVRVPAEDVVLPEGTLERVERQVLGVARHRDRLRAAGQHLKRGVLLYGPPGTGKTHTVRHLLGADAETTAIVLAGQSLGLVRLATETAHALQPAVVVLEDVDLISEDRSLHAGPQPLLFEVLDAMDGLGGDADVAFLLTTNRADLLERALAQRPGRVDLAVEIPLPDDDARLRLFRLYADGLPLTPGALDDAAGATAGVTASFVKEVIRRAVLLAAEDDRTVDDAALRAAVAELTDDTQRVTRSLLGAGAGQPE